MWLIAALTQNTTKWQLMELRWLQFVVFYAVDDHVWEEKPATQRGNWESDSCCFLLQVNPVSIEPWRKLYRRSYCSWNTRTALKWPSSSRSGKRLHAYFVVLIVWEDNHSLSHTHDIIELMFVTGFLRKMVHSSIHITRRHSVLEKDFKCHNITSQKCPTTSGWIRSMQASLMIELCWHKITVKSHIIRTK